MSEKNPFIEAFSKEDGFGTFDNVIPFDQIKPEHYLPALDWAIDRARAQIALIKAEETPTFANTIEQLETSSEYMKIIRVTFENLFEAHNNDALKAIVEEIQKRGTAFNDEIGLDAELFKRIKNVFEGSRDGLTPEQNRLVDTVYKGFVRGGALLSPEDKELCKEINGELAGLYPKFSENVRQETNNYEFIIDKEEDLAGIPDIAKEVAKEEAQKKGYKEKRLFTLQGPSYLPFICYADKRELRERFMRAGATKATSGEHSNMEIIKKIISLRLKKAQLLGFNTHADFVLDNRMAKTLNTVQGFLDTLKSNYFSHAQKEIEQVKVFAKERDGIEQLQSWDSLYYEEKLKEQLFNFNDETLRPYFKLENVVHGVFVCANKLYGLEFIERNDIPVYHEDVKAYEVRDENKEYIGVFYTDFFPRESKRGGGRMTTFRDQGLFQGKLRRPHVSIVCNFTKPTKEKPSLLTYDEVQTLFHEFGHTLHNLFSECTYTSLSGTNVLWDFVELPSQLMEFWSREKEGLDLFAKHYETGETIPTELLKKIKDAENFMVAGNGLGQIKLGLIDMLRHAKSQDNVEDIMEEEALLMQQAALLPRIDGAFRSAGFTHIFVSGYDSGYYSYKRAELLAADAFEYFKENGIFNKEIAKKFKENVLQSGNTAEPMDLYKAFRGKEPDPKALLRSEGLA